MNGQNYKNHVQMVPPYHYGLFGLLLLGLIGSCVNLYESMGNHDRVYSASLLVLAFVTLILTALYARIFALKAQDRAIRAEENMRCFVMTGKLLDPRLQVRQIIALRFAPDAEFLELAKRAADQNMEPKDIKMAIKNWRGDYYRV